MLIASNKSVSTEIEKRTITAFYDPPLANDPAWVCIVIDYDNLPHSTLERRNEVYIRKPGKFYNIVTKFLRLSIAAYNFIYFF